MAQGYSLHIGLNHIDSTSPDYEGIVAPVLSGCVNDASSMEALARMQGFQHTTTLTDAQATSTGVVDHLMSAADSLQCGDALLLTYAGHGSRVECKNCGRTAGSAKAWVLYDRMLLDDELSQTWTHFQPGVRIMMLSDSCHSGAVDNRLFEHRRTRTLAATDRLAAATLLAERHPGVLMLPVVRPSDIAASGVLMSACRDDQTAQDGEKNGLFTQALLQVWGTMAAYGDFEGTYATLVEAIRRKMPATQSPVCKYFGRAAPDFEAERPFTLSDGRAVVPRGEPLASDDADVVAKSLRSAHDLSTA